MFATLAQIMQFAVLVADQANLVKSLVLLTYILTYLLTYLLTFFLSFLLSLYVHTVASWPAHTTLPSEAREERTAVECSLGCIDMGV